jgi:hypothetical protein
LFICYAELSLIEKKPVDMEYTNLKLFSDNEATDMPFENHEMTFNNGGNRVCFFSGLIIFNYVRVQGV